MLHMEHAYRFLKERIISYQLRPGQRITEVQVANELGVSRTPVREALRRLDQEGWLTSNPHQGYWVRTYTRQELDDVYEFRIAIERHIVRLAARREPSPELMKLAAEWARLGDEKRPTDPLLWLQADETFHLSLGEASQSEELLSALKRINERIRLIRRIDFTRAERAERTVNEHVQILQSVLAGDGDRAAEDMDRHIATSKENVKALAQIYLTSDNDVAEGRYTRTVSASLSTRSEQKVTRPDGDGRG